MAPLDSLRKGRRRHGLTRFLARHGRQQADRVLHRLDQRTLVRHFRDLGIEPGTTVCAHASLRRLGYVMGGPDTVIDALLEVLGPTGTLMMPSFPMAGAALDFLESGQAFDVLQSPSANGAITEAFRTRPSVRRSLHPTNPVAAVGSRSAELLRDHDDSPTPFGRHTPYGRLAEDEDGFVLMLETHVHSLLHHLQERVGFPNLFLDGDREATVVDRAGRHRSVRTRVMRPRVSYFVAVPSPRGDHDPDWSILHDFALIFPSRRDEAIRRVGYTFEGYPTLFRRRDAFLRQGLLRRRRIGRGEAGLLHVPGFLRRIEPELSHLTERFRDHYRPERIMRLELPYL